MVHSGNCFMWHICRNSITKEKIIEVYNRVKDE